MRDVYLMSSIGKLMPISRFSIAWTVAPKPAGITNVVDRRSQQHWQCRGRRAHRRCSRKANTHHPHHLPHPPSTRSPLPVCVFMRGPHFGPCCAPHTRPGRILFLVRACTFTMGLRRVCFTHIAPLAEDSNNKTTQASLLCALRHQIERFTQLVSSNQNRILIHPQ